MLLRETQYVNIHAHRPASGPDEWVLTSIDFSGTDNLKLKKEACYSIGIHPWSLENSDLDRLLIELVGVLNAYPIIAIGETGLDRAILTSADLQLKVFKYQVELAEKYSLPVIIHSVRSTQELLQFINVVQPLVPLIIHGFRGNLQQAMELVRNGFYLSVGAALLRSDKLKKVIKEIELEKLFLETDEASVSIEHIYREVSDLRDISIHDLRNHMQEKVVRYFKNSSNERNG